MHALLFDRIGEPGEVLTLRDIPDPQPGPAEALVRVLLAPVQPSDLHMMRGRYGYQPPLPASPGVEAVGIVEALGPGVSAPAVGTRVIFVGIWNLWRERVVCNAHRLVSVPDAISDEAAATSFVNPVTAWGLTLVSHAMQQDEWLLQTAAGSSVGKLVLQLARHHGFKTINVIRRRSQEPEIRTLGGDVVICTEDEDLRARIKEVTNGQGVLKAIDCVAGDTGADVARSLAPGGTMLQYGALSTHGQTDPRKLVMPLFSPQLIYATATVRGWWLARWLTEQPPPRVGEIIGQILSLIATGTLSAPAGTVFPLTRVKDALQASESAGHSGKALLRIST